MKVPTAPISPAGAERPPARTGGGNTGRAERDDSALQEDADLFKQAMSDTTKEPADTTRRDEPGKARESGSEAAATRAGALQGEAAAGRAARQGEPGKVRERAGEAGADQAGAAFQGEFRRAPAGAGETAAARAGALRGETGKAQESGLETTGAVADAKDPARSEGADETGPEAGVETQQNLQDLLAMQVAQSRMAPVQRAEAGAPQAISPELVADIAQRILVSAAEHGQDKEVRIQVKDTVLNDTEVVISRQKGELVVVFETRSHTDNVLLSNSREAMTATLQSALDGPVRIDINAESPDTDPRDRRDRRSRGMYIQEDDVA